MTFNRLYPEDKAKELIKEGRWNGVLYVNQSAITAAAEKRPIALNVDCDGLSRRCLNANGWSDNGARVALVKGAKPEPKLVDVTAMENLLRRLGPAEETHQKLDGVLTENYLRPFKELIDSVNALRVSYENKE
jgi:hypothetical protein